MIEPVLTGLDDLQAAVDPSKLNYLGGYSVSFPRISLCPKVDTRIDARSSRCGPPRFPLQGRSADESIPLERLALLRIWEIGKGPISTPSQVKVDFILPVHTGASSTMWIHAELAAAHQSNSKKRSTQHRFCTSTQGDYYSPERILDGRLEVRTHGSYMHPQKQVLIWRFPQGVSNGYIKAWKWPFADG